MGDSQQGLLLDRGPSEGPTGGVAGEGRRLLRGNLRGRIAARSLRKEIWAGGIGGSGGGEGGGGGIHLSWALSPWTLWRSLRLMRLALIKVMGQGSEGDRVQSE